MKLLVVVVLLFGLLNDAVSGYIVRRNIKEYGAVGDGVTDDTNAFILALTYERGDIANATYGHTKYSPSTKTPAYVYVPSGTYLVTASLPVIYYTELVGDAFSPPTIKFVSNSRTQHIVLDTFGSWYPDISQNNFYRRISNFVVDTTSCTNCVGVQWRVSQSTSITNVYFKAGKSANNIGMLMYDGSGGFFSDLIFEGGGYGLWVGNQQFTLRNITIRNTTIAGIFLNWDWVWTFKGLHISNTPVAIQLTSGVGSLAVIDSYFENTTVGISTTFPIPPLANNTWNGLYLENLIVNSPVDNAVIVLDSSPKNVATVVKGGPAGITVIKAWAQGVVWQGDMTLTDIRDFSAQTPARPSSLITSTGEYFELSRPLYVGVPVVDVTTIGILANGADISSLLQNALNTYNNTAVLFFPSGMYIIDNTVIVPPGTRMVGEAWAELAADGPNFQNANIPTPVLQIGQPGQTGVAQISGFVIGHRGPQPGAKQVEWNLHDPDGAPGSNGMWDIVFRTGGTQAEGLLAANCRPDNGTNSTAAQCTAVWGMLHVTTFGNVYLENVWGWTADHNIDLGSQVNIYTARGFLCESQGPVWGYGTAFEHNSLYQYNLQNSKDIFLGLIQTESPYYQPSTLTPFAPNYPSDPSFCTDNRLCNMSYALVINNSTNIYTYGAGMYSWFDVWTQQCLNYNCQKNIVQVLNSAHLYMYALSTVGSIYGLSENEGFTYSANPINENTFASTAIINTKWF